MADVFKKLFIKPGILHDEQVTMVKCDQDPQIKEIYRKFGKLKEYQQHKKEWKRWRKQHSPLRYDPVSGTWSGKEKPPRFSNSKGDRK